MRLRLNGLSWLLLWLVAFTCEARYQTDWVEFPALKEFEGKPVQLKALVYRPEGTGPFAAIVLLHGCGGMFTPERELTASYRNWSELLSERGFVTVLPDSFGPRGHFSICDQQKRTILESRERVEDAYAALGWLNGQPFVARGRVGLLGWSNGGAGTLYAMRESREYRGFAAAIAFYPGCRTLSKATPPYLPYAPLLILSGEADDWTPAALCVALAETARERGGSVDIVTYPGAHHGFDRINLPVRYRPTVRNLNNPDKMGATVGEHPGAREDSIRRVVAFFAKNLRN